jgi:hypothetical protein
MDEKQYLKPVVLDAEEIEFCRRAADHIRIHVRRTSPFHLITIYGDPSEWALTLKSVNDPRQVSEAAGSVVFVFEVGSSNPISGSAWSEYECYVRVSARDLGRAVALAQRIIVLADKIWDPDTRQHLVKSRAS